MTGQCIVTATIAAYAGGSVTANFTKQGGGAPSIGQNSATIDQNGTFVLSAWDNTNPLYAPSITTFIIQVGHISYSAAVQIAGTAVDISAAFSHSPSLPSLPSSPSGNGVPSVNGITDAVTIAAGSNLGMTKAGGTLTL